MSARKTIWIRCEDCGKEVEFVAGTVDLARQRLRILGWLVAVGRQALDHRRLDHTLDLCPDCGPRKGAGDG